VNECWCEMTAFTRDRALGQGWLAALYPDDRERVLAEWRVAAAAGVPFRSEQRLLSTAGRVLWVIGRSVPVHDDSGQITGHIWTVADITELRQHERRIARLNRVHAVLSGINATIVRVRDRAALFEEARRIAVEEGQFQLARIDIVDPRSGEVAPNEHRIAAAADGLVAEALEARSLVVCNDVERDPRMAERRAAALAEGYRSVAVLPLVVAGRILGSLSLCAGEAEFFDEEELKLLRELASDISFALDHIEKEEQLDYLAHFDPITELPNRTLFYDRVAQAIDAGASGKRLAVVFADLERFKNINDTLGRHVGDELLYQAAERIQRAVPEIHSLSRVHADCFAGMLADFERAEQAARELQRQLKRAMAEPFIIDGQELRLALRSGVAFFPNDGPDADSLLRNAEAALKRAKSLSESFVLYTPDINARVADELALENKLRRAVEEERFTLHYQPKVELATGRVTGVEALVRWLDPELGDVPAERFIPILEDTGLILEVGRWALHKAAAVAAGWRSAGLPPIRIAVNVSAIQLRDKDFVASVERAVAGPGRVGPGIDLEITESVIMRDTGGNVAKLRAVRDMGVEIAIDDFGTGYSSLAYIAKLPVSVIKVDRSFINTLGSDPDSKTIVSSMIKLGRALNLKVVAEGVETPEQARLLRVLECSEYQGYFFSPPVPAARIEAMLRQSIRAAG